MAAPVTIRRFAGKIVLDDPLIEAICGAVKHGASVAVAAERVGVSEKTVSRWLARGRAALAVDPAAGEGDGPEAVYARLSLQRPQAEATAEVALSSLIVAAAQGGALIEDRRIVHPSGEVESVKRYSQPDWRAAAFILERRIPGRWARQLKLDMHHSFTPVTDGPEGERINAALSAFLALEGAQRPVIEGETE